MVIAAILYFFIMKAEKLKNCIKSEYQAQRKICNFEMLVRAPNWPTKIYKTVFHMRRKTKVLCACLENQGSSVLRTILPNKVQIKYNTCTNTKYQQVQC